MDYSSHLLSSHATALATAAFVFFITLFMVARQWIGLSITVILLLFSLVAGLLIANHDLLRNAVNGTPTEHIRDVEVKMATFNEHILKSYDSLKAELEVQKHALKTLSDKVEELQESLPSRNTDS